jgi:hypothetical protein
LYNRFGAPTKTQKCTVEFIEPEYKDNEQIIRDEQTKEEFIKQGLINSRAPPTKEGSAGQVTFIKKWLDKIGQKRKENNYD